MNRSENLNYCIAVTGASKGIGAAIALELAQRGFTVACLSRSGALPANHQNIASGTSDKLVGISCDITDPESVGAALSEADQYSGGLGGIVNNAGIATGGSSASLPLSAFEEVMKTNVTGLFSVCQTAYPFLEKRESSLIVNIGSFWDRIGGKSYVAYCASKAAIAAITRSLAVEWARQGIRVLDVAPGYVKTDMNADQLEQEHVKAHLKKRIPRGYPGTPEEIAKLVASLFCENIAYLTGTTICIDGGQSIAP